MDWWGWNRRNLLSTIGNINWYCSYLAVALPLLLYCFWAGEGWRRIPAGIGAYVGTGAMLLQGSASGYAALAAMYGVLLFASLRDRRKLLRFLETALLPPLFSFLAWLTQMDLILPFDMEAAVGRIFTPLWGIPLGVLAVAAAVLRVAYRKGGRDRLASGRTLNIALASASVCFVACVLILAGCQISDEIWSFFGSPAFLRLGGEWGSGRGELWSAVWGGFCRSGFVTKLYGAGPDCFARYFYEVEALNLETIGQWEDAIYANAHNEWLNMLVNQGILGAAAYLGFFLSAFGRFWRMREKNRRMTAGMMAVGAYLANQFFSFGQVVSTPLIFLVIAVCENECRMTEAGKGNKDGRE